jgi:transcriptional regulator with XRE-family HTH domain
MLALREVVTLPGLRRARLNAALSQRDLARRAGVAASTITRIETGAQAHPSTMRKLADALGCTPRDLMQPESP